MKEFIDHYSRVYKVAIDGEVILSDGTRTYGKRSKKGDKHLYIHHKGIWVYVHRLVAEVYKNNNQPIPEGYVVHHINGDPADNRAENLLILSHSEHNRLHASSRYGEKNSFFGKHHSEETKHKIADAKKGKYTLGDNPRAKAVVGTNKATGEVREFSCAAEAAMILNINGDKIRACCRGERKSSGGWLWHKKNP